MYGKTSSRMKSRSSLPLLKRQAIAQLLPELSIHLDQFFPSSVELPRADGAELSPNAMLFPISKGNREYDISRPPFMLESSLPGVFAVGDVRAGSVKRVPLRRSSPLWASSSKTPKRQTRGVLTGMPMSTLLWVGKKLYTVPDAAASRTLLGNCGRSGATLP
jgi:hypothetical protein